MANLREWSHQSYSQMILFDDKPENMDVELWQGVTFVKIKDNRVGITWSDYNQGLDLWRRYQAIRRSIPSKGINSSKTRLIGYVGADYASATRYSSGKRRLKSDRAARWGYGLYVADNPCIAEFFAKWGRENDHQNQWVIALYTRDWDTFEKMHKTDQATAAGQERLDNRIIDKFGVQKPFVLFSRHLYMNGMTFLKRGERFNEMVLYPNLQDALFFGDMVHIDEAVAHRQSGKWSIGNWHLYTKEIGIKVIEETRREFRDYGEKIE